MTAEQFLELTRVLPEPLLLVSGTGELIAVNPPVLALLQMDGETLTGKSLFDFTDTPPDKLLPFLRNCSKSRAMVLGALALRSNGGEVALYRCEGAVFRPRSPAAPALILLRLKPKESASSRFALLTQKIDLLAKEIAERKRAETALSARERRSHLLAEISHVLASSMNCEITLNQVAQLIVPALGDLCFFDLVTENYKMQRVAWRHVNREQQELFNDVARYVPARQFRNHPILKALLTGNTVFVPNVTDEWMQQAATSAEHLHLMRSLGFHSLITVVLSMREQMLGTLTLCRVAPSPPFTQADVEFVEDMAGRIALAVQNIKLYHEAEEASRLKDEFLATVSHELRTPLSAMLGWARVLRTASLDETGVNHALEAIERNAKAQAQLIEDLLDVSRIIAGRLRLDLRPVELITVIEAAVDTVRPSADNKNIRLQMMFDPKASTVSGDPGRLQQVVWNLLSNAIKFTPKGGRVQIRLERVDSHIEITVSDTGEGIDPEFLPYVFDRFRQADATQARKHGGLGLGLAIARHLVELHGGTVHAYSDGVGQGATFIVKLPLMIVHERERSAAQAFQWEYSRCSAETPAALAGLQLLIVDDEADARDLLKTILENCAATITSAATAAQALQLLETCKPDVLVSDIEMPGEDGYALIRQVRALPNATIASLPAIALTAHARVEDRLRALSSGYDSHVAKPFEPAELITVIASLARRSKGV